MRLDSKLNFTTNRLGVNESSLLNYKFMANVLNKKYMSSMVDAVRCLTGFGLSKRRHWNPRSTDWYRLTNYE